jgi:hypothetical protein
MLQPSPFQNMNKVHQENNRNMPQVQGSKLVKLGFKKENDNPREPFEMLGMWRTTFIDKLSLQEFCK